MVFIKAINLHRLGYRATLDIQQSLFRRVKKEAFENSNQNPRAYLLFVEHEPVYTIGIRDKLYKDVEFQEKLKKTGADFVATNRGGLITFHGPGQLVVYPILNLADFPATKKSVKKFVCILEKTIIDLCTEHGISTAGRLDAHPGVWIENDRKIAAVGIHCSRYVTMHGIALNCNLDFEWYDHIVPCGIENKTVTSLSRELGQNIAPADVIDKFTRHFHRSMESEQ